MTADDRPVILFDAICILCSAHARFILKHDRSRHFRLASIQSPAGAALCRRFRIDPADPETLIFATGDVALRNSDAVIAIGSGLGWPWRAAGMLRAVPRPLRDALYRSAARNRYRLFGRREPCFVPDAADRERLL